LFIDVLSLISITGFERLASYPFEFKLAVFKIKDLALVLFD